MGKRRPVSESTIADITMQSRRRCCLCVFLCGDNHLKKGQIAHINKDPSNNSFDNLVFLCLDHHDEFDSQTSVSKGLTQTEVKRYRDRLYERNENAQPRSKKQTPTTSINDEPANDSIEVEPFFWLAQCHVAWSTSGMELAYDAFNAQANSLSIPINRDELSEDDSLAESLVLIKETLTDRYGEKAAGIFGMGIMVALLPFSFESIDDFRSAKAAVEGIALKSFNIQALVATTEFLNQLPCEIPAFAEKVEDYKKSLQAAITES